MPVYDQVGVDNAISELQQTNNDSARMMSVFGWLKRVWNAVMGIPCEDCLKRRADLSVALQEKENLQRRLNVAQQRSNILFDRVAEIDHKADAITPDPVDDTHTECTPAAQDAETGKKHSTRTPGLNLRKNFSRMDLEQTAGDVLKGCNKRPVTNKPIVDACSGHADVVMAD